MRKIFIAIGLSLISFFLQGQEQSKLHLKGNLSDLDKQDKVFVTLGDNTQVPLEIMQNGDFQISAILPQTGASVTLDIIGPKGFAYTFFYLGNENVEINASALNLSGDVRAVGSVLDSVRYKRYKATKHISQEIDQLESQYELASEKTNNIDSLRTAFLAKEELLDKQEAQINYEFLKEHINTPYGMHLLRFEVGANSKSQSGELLALVDKEYQHREEVDFLKTYVSYPVLEDKELYYDFVAHNFKGDPVYFRDQFDGRYVVLDFSHPHCGYCIKSADQINKLASDLSQKVNVFTVMPDNDPKALQDLAKLRLSSDMVYYTPKGELDPALAKYNKNMTPTYVVFSPKGELLVYKRGSDIDLQGFLLNHMQQNNF